MTSRGRVAGGKGFGNKTSIALNKGKSTTVDESDYVELSRHKWHFDINGYARRGSRVDGRCRPVLMHRWLLGAVAGQTCDHIDGDRLNNSRSNLRLVTMAENARNRITERMLAGLYKGVHPIGGKWKAVIRVDGRLLHLGRFFHSQEAALAYDAAARKYFGEFARCNYPDES